MRGIKDLRPSLSHPLSQAKPKGGAPKGNRNAFKHGGFTSVSRARSKEIRTLCRESGQMADIALARWQAQRRVPADTMPRKDGAGGD